MEPARLRHTTLKYLWGSSFLLWWGLCFELGPARLTLAYGSYLLWAASAGFLWGRKAPFLAVGLFLVAVGTLSWIHPSRETGRWLTPELIPWTLLVLMSSLASYRELRVRHEKLRLRNLQQSFVPLMQFFCLGRMAVSITHELKNQIAVTVGFLDLLNVETGFSDIQRKMIHRSLAANDKMLTILDRLRMLSNLTSQNSRQPVDLNQSIQEAALFLERSFYFRNIVLDLKLQEDIPLVEADAAMLQIIFIYFLQQSLENFTNPKPADEPPQTVHITTRCAGGPIQIHYLDNSQGRETFTTHELVWTALQELISKQGGTMTMGLHHSRGSEINLHWPLAKMKPHTDNQG